MRVVLRSIKPYWLYLILIGEKTIEVGKNEPKATEWDRTVCLYCSKDKKSLNRIPQADREWFSQFVGKVACQFVCDKITYITADIINGTKHLGNIFGLNTCLTDEELFDYIYCGKGKENCGRGWHISDLKIYEKPKELREFRKADICKHYDGGCDCWSELCKIAQNNDCHCGHIRLTRPPQSWCYVEGLK